MVFFNVLIFLVILSVLVLSHELGHFLLAKRAGIKVEEFGLGFPPRIWGKKIGETTYSVNAVLFGGFVRLFGEDAPVKDGDKRRTFYAQSRRVRAGVVSAGVFMNFLLAVILFSIIYSVLGIPTPSNKVTVVGIAPGSPAQTSGFALDDRVVAVDGVAVGSMEEFVELVRQRRGEEVQVEVEREVNGQVSRQPLAVTPRVEHPEEEGPLGVVVSSIEMRRYPLWQMPARGAVEGLREAFAWTGLIVSLLFGLLWQLVSTGSVPADAVAGPVGIFQLSSQVAQAGIISTMQFVGILSVNLAVLNILPFPALDGGRLAFIGLEVLTGRRSHPRVERVAHAAGMAFLLFLLLLVTINDIIRIFSTSTFGQNLGRYLPF